MNKRYLAACAMLLCLTGCSIGPDYVRPEVAEYANWQLEYQGNEKLADGKWWQQFGDPVLDSLIEEAVQNNLELKTATARVSQYLGILDTTRSQYFPQIGAGFDAGGKREAGQTTELYKAALTASWELDLWGRVRRSSEAAQARILATEAGRQGVLMTLVSNVASGYITLLGLDQQLEIARATETAYLESLRLFELRYKYGTVSQLEVSQIRSQYELAGQSIAAYQSQIRQQENLLSLLLGKVPGQIPRGKGIESLTAPAIPAGLPSQLLERRPDIIQAEQELIAANANIGAARAEYFPRISLTGALGVASDDMGRLFGSGSGIWSAAGAATMPLLNFGQIAGQVRQAEAVEQQALYNYQQAILSSFRDVEDALVKSSKGEEQLKAQERQVAALEDYAQLSQLQFDAGTSSYLQVLDAERSLFSGKLSMTQTRYEQLVSLISVYKAMGGGWIAEADRLAEEKGKQAE